MRALLAAALACPLWAQNPLRPDPLRPVEENFAAARYAEVVRSLKDGAVVLLPRRRRARAFALLGKSYERLGRIEEALRVYQLAQGLYPDDIDILSNLAELLHRSQLDDRAQPYYERVLKIHPNNGLSHRGLAEIRRSQGMLRDSAGHFVKALEEFDEDASLWREYAGVLTELKEMSDAFDALRKSLSLSRDPDTLIEMAKLQRRRGDRAAAARTLDEALRAAPRPALLDLQALWLLEDGDAADAAAAAGKVIQMDAFDPLARWIRASAALRRGDRALARKDLAVASSQDDHPFIARVAAAMARGLRSKEKEDQ